MGFRIADDCPDLTPHPALDLRRRRDREISELLIHNSRWIRPSERAIVLAYHKHGLSAADIAHARGEDPRTTRRRLRIISKRLLSGQFAFVLSKRDSWPAQRRRVANACILQGRTTRDASRYLRVSVYTVRRHLTTINSLFEASQ